MQRIKKVDGMTENNIVLKDLESLLDQWTSTSLGRRSFLVSVPLLLTACGAPSRTRYREGDNTGQHTELSVADEKRMTAEVLPQMKKDYPEIPDQQLQKYIKSLGAEIASKNDLEGKPYHYNFSVVGVPYVNAFALPAGTIFVTAPLIEMADNEAELAGVIGHEIGHVKARHTAERMARAKRDQNKSILAGALGGLLGGAAGFGLGKLLCPPKDDACLAKASALGAAGGLGAGLLIRKYQFMANSREDEMEADRVGFRTSVQAGYSKEHVGDFYEKLLVMEQQHQKSSTPLLGSIADAMSTHPPSKERVAQMKEMEQQSTQVDGKKNSHDFENAKDRSVAWIKSQKKK